jgi:hypothetical protein
MLLACLSRIEANNMFAYSATITLKHQAGPQPCLLARSSFDPSLAGG